MRAFVAALLTVLTLVAAPVAAQDQTPPDFAQWEQVASAAEALVDDPDADDEALNRTRATLIEWRGRFAEAQTVNSDRIAAVQEQISALGDPPAEGQTEDADVAARRAELQQQLSTLQAPQLTATEAHSRADLLIQDIAQIIAERQARVIARQSPSPVLPQYWLEAGAAAIALGTEIVTNFQARMSNTAVWDLLRPRLPLVIGYLAAALILLTAGRHWVRSLPSRMSARATDYSRAVVAFVVSLGQIIIPMLGVYLAVRGLRETGFFAEWTMPFLNALPGAGVILFGGVWLAGIMFPRKAIAYQTLNMPDAARGSAYSMVVALVLTYLLHYVLGYAVLPPSGIYWRAGDPETQVPMDFTEGAVSVVHFVMIVAAAVALFRLGHILRNLRKWASPEDPSFRIRVLRVMGVASRIIAVGAVGLATIGFINLANVLIWPWILTLALVLLLISLQDFIADVVNMIKRGQEGAREGLVPLLIGFILVILSVPLFLIIWGARRQDLLEQWGAFMQGVSLGGVRLSPGSVLTFLIVLGIGYAITRAVQGALRTQVLPKTRLDQGGQNAVVSGLGYLGIGLAALAAITAAGIDMSSLAIVAGALSVGIGFGLQNIVSNFVSGIILLIERPIAVGDWIDAGGQQGIVKRISVRATSVQTFDRTELILPNSDLISQPVTNYTRHDRMGRIILPIGVAPTADTRRVAEILMEIVEDQPTVTIDPAPSVLFRGISVDTMNFEIRAVLANVDDGLSVTSEIYHRVVERFVEEGIELPFTVRDRWPTRPAPEGDGADAAQALLHCDTGEADAEATGQS